MKVLLSEASSLSARETITALGLGGQTVDLLSSSRFNLGKFSWFVNNSYPVPLAGVDPEGYLAAALDVIATHDIDVLIPVHEQAYLFAARRDLIPADVGVALASFESFEQVQSKARLASLLSRLRIPQPETVEIGVNDLAALNRPFPFYVKTAFGTASVGVWRVVNADDQRAAVAALVQSGAKSAVVQAELEGSLERAQAVFDKGRLVACHTYRQLAEGPGGGDILKVSVTRPDVVQHIEVIGAELSWHGALSFDYIFDDKTGTRGFIDANPRLVEPMNGLLSGVDLAGALLAVSAGRSPPRQPPGKAGVTTRLAIMGLISAGQRRCSRVDVLREACLIAFGLGRYRGAKEELTPVRHDPWLAFAVLGLLITLLITPSHARKFTSGAVRNYSLTPETIRKLQSWNGGSIAASAVATATAILSDAAT